MYKDLGGEGVPHIVIGKHIIPDFSPQKVIDAALDVGILRKK